ncbi:catecholate siderophore receptor [Acinetobacter marinus]|uniref:Catecholate siderophore receptor n=1 Tax=Acinetobacter marinus TaxID=281375 RepID=A0A1G6HU51_9GAMM|nr:catecholate siderophore receptor Fiu [Acinetobacter marinus]SDB97734.1 catecholate siderophore receptor [Acinetobacter marinus]
MSMIKSRKRPCASQLLAVAAAALPFATHAVDQVVELPTIEVKAEQEGYKVDKVSSSKFTQPLVDTTQTVAIIGKDILQEQSASTLTEALRNVPGVGTFALGENGRMNTGDAVTMRGFDVSNSIFVDGIRDLGNISRDVFNIEQIEVFKGAAGTDNGRTAASGSINLKSKEAQAQDFNRASIGFGSDSYSRGTVDLNQAVSDGTALRLNAMVEQADGINRDGVENKKWGIAPSLAFGLDTDTRLFLNYLHIEQDNVIDGGVSTVGLDGFDASRNPTYAAIADYLNSHPVDASTFYGSNSDFDDVKADMATLRIEHDISEQSKLSSALRWGRMTHKYLATIPMGFTVNGDAEDTLIGRSGNNGDTVNKILTSQTNLSTVFNTGSVQHNLSTGIEITQEEMDSYGYDVTVLPTSLYDPDADLESSMTRNPSYSNGQLDTYSIYAFDTLKLSPRWSVNGGVRLDHYKLNAKGISNTAGRGQPANYESFQSDTSDNLFNWKAGVLFKPTENGSIYANYSVQQQPPGTITGGDGLASSNAFAPSTSANSNNNLAMDPQKTNNAEIGTKWEFMDKRLLLSGAVFHTELSNEMTQDDDGNYYQNGKKSVQGVELGAVGQITDQWQLSAGYTYQDSEIENVTQAIGTGAVSADGSDEIPFTPTDAFTLWSTYKTDKWSIGGGTRYIGEMKKSRDGNQVGPSVVPDYWVVDAMASYQVTKNIGIQLNVNNLFDEEYIASINRGGWRYIPGAERNYRAALNFNF